MNFCCAIADGLFVVPSSLQEADSSRSEFQSDEIEVSGMMEPGPPEDLVTTTTTDELPSSNGSLFPSSSTRLLEDEPEDDGTIPLLQPGKIIQYQTCTDSSNSDCLKSVFKSNHNLSNIILRTPRASFFKN